MIIATRARSHHARAAPREVEGERRGGGSIAPVPREPRTVPAHREQEQAAQPLHRSGLVKVSAGGGIFKLKKK